MESIIYDYAIIGAGAAGLQLCMSMIDDPFFQDKKILIIDKDKKNKNDRTWCYWEKGDGEWDHLIHHQWKEGYFYSTGFEKLMILSPYRYKMLRAIDFYNYTKKKITEHLNCHWVQGSVEYLTEKEFVEINASNNNYLAKQVFDSRIPKDFHNKDDKYIRLLQHFKGWVIQTESDFFDPDRFVMMDFRLKWKGSTSFTYVLPTSEREALVEFTLFTGELINNEDYEEMLKIYLDKYLQLKEYKIAETEKGIIPMSNFPFTKYHQKNITKIGTGGAWVKPSSGYSFKNCERYSQKIINNIKTGKNPTTNLISKHHRLYDTIFLEVLLNQNHLGEEIFTDMYKNNNVQKILSFLDEETSFIEDIKIMNSFRSAPFLKALFSQIATQWKP